MQFTSFWEPQPAPPETLMESTTGAVAVISGGAASIATVVVQTVLFVLLAIKAIIWDNGVMFAVNTLVGYSEAPQIENGFSLSKTTALVLPLSDKQTPIDLMVDSMARILCGVQHTFEKAAEYPAALMEMQKDPEAVKIHLQVILATMLAVIAFHLWTTKLHKIVNNLISDIVRQCFPMSKKSKEESIKYDGHPDQETCEKMTEYDDDDEEIERDNILVESLPGHEQGDEEIALQANIDWSHTRFDTHAGMNEVQPGRRALNTRIPKPRQKIKKSSSH